MCGSPRTRRPTRRRRVRSSRPGRRRAGTCRSGAPGVRVGAGFYDASTARLASVREAIVHDRHGPELEEILAALQAAGWTLGGHTLKTAPRGYDVDHPRIELLRHKSMTLGKDYGFEPFIHTPRAARPGPLRLARDPAVRRLGARAMPRDDDRPRRHPAQM